MKVLMASTLIVFGCVWLLYSMIMPSVNRSAALSNAMQLEANLEAWAYSKASQGKLNQNDIDEIFSEKRGLTLGGENPENSFQEMIKDIVYSSAPPIWPGVVAIFVGMLGVGYSLRISPKKQQAEQVAAPDS